MEAELPLTFDEGMPNKEFCRKLPSQLLKAGCDQIAKLLAVVPDLLGEDDSC